MNKHDNEQNRFTLQGRLKSWAERLKREIITIYLVFMDSRTPVLARITAGAVVVYAFSPIDLIPDFIPLLGYLDDLILLPLGIALVMWMVPEDVLMHCRKMAQEQSPEVCIPGWLSSALVICTWFLILTAVYLLGLWIKNS